MAATRQCVERRFLIGRASALLLAGALAPYAARAAEHDLRDATAAVVKVRVSGIAVVDSGGPEEARRGTSTEGTGFFVLQAGYILTAHHVVFPAGVEWQETPQITIEQERSGHLEKFDARIEERDPASDLILLKSERPIQRPIAVGLAAEPETGLDLSLLGLSPGSWSVEVVPVVVRGRDSCSDRPGVSIGSTRATAGMSGAPVLGKDGSVYGVFVAADRAGYAACYARVTANSPVLSRVRELVISTLLKQRIWMGTAKKSTRFAVLLSTALPALWLRKTANDSASDFNEAAKGLPPPPGTAATRQEQTEYNQRVRSLQSMREDAIGKDRTANWVAAGTGLLAAFLGKKMCLWFCPVDEAGLAAGQLRRSAEVEIRPRERGLAMALKVPLGRRR